ncbi:diguanylate cyclase [Telmatobacter bradus]|uniref:diguanylate cyclase n=1 Tax=Telmatobacter bradus TaxID=474953 RepID=UPI003B42D5CF
MTPTPKGRMPLDDLLVFHRLTRSLTSSFDLDKILHTILEHMEQTIEAELWTLLMRQEEADELYYAIAAGGEQKALSGLRVKVGEGIAGWVAEHGETLIVPEASHDPRLQASSSAKPQIVRSVIALPLRGRKGIQGVIEIYNPHTEQMTDYAIAFLHILADHAAIAIENARDVARIQQLTITDDTTGLYNVRHLYEVLTRTLNENLSQHKPLSLLFLDLDHFKLVNDEHGHLVGSELLARVGQKLQQLSRKQDWCFRYGGDEFVILLPETSQAEAMHQANKLLRQLMQAHFALKNGPVLTVSASVGLATAPVDGQSMHAIIGQADARMYEVKNSGRGRVSAG